MCDAGDSRLPHVNQTWLPHCDLSLFIGSSSSDGIVGLNVTGGRRHIATKSKAAWTYIYNNHLLDAEYFVKADPDTFLVVENLKYYLQHHDPDKCEFFGHTFHLPGYELLYNSGGPGQVLSRQSVRKLVTEAFRQITNCMPDGEGKSQNT